MSLESDVFRRRFKSDNDENHEYFNEKQLMEKLCDKKKSVPIFRKSEKSFFENFLILLHETKCPSSLGLIRALFGLMMVVDIPDERNLGQIDLKYGDPMRCHFPLIDYLSPLPLEYMGLLYFIMWLGAFGICLGLMFKFSCLIFILPYWYIYFLDKTVWNNHSYLYGLVAILFSVTNANHSFSLDMLLNPQIKNKPVPMWNYAIIRFQFFLLYFYAGIKKFDPDWIGGYSMTSLSLHWVFNPFRIVLNNEQIDFWIIHIFGFLFDLTVGFFLLIDKTRPIAMIFSTAFHLMNSCMFHIGQFPYVCLVTMPIFCSYDWPEQLNKCFKVGGYSSQKNEIENVSKEKIQNEVNSTVSWKHRLTFLSLATYIGVQLFLPFSHFITQGIWLILLLTEFHSYQGYNNWTNGLYGYSWDMMVQSWDSNVVVVKVVDNQSKKEYFLDPEAWVGNTRYSKHGDMLVQYAKCLKKNLNSRAISTMQDAQDGPIFNDISIYVDVWCSLNGRFRQRMFDPRQDLLKVEWSPFKKIPWLMPLLSELSPWRKKLSDLEKEVFEWSNYSDVLFVADFPGLSHENYITSDFSNVTLTVLQGTVVLEQVTNANNFQLMNVTLTKGESCKVKVEVFHKVYTVSKEPSCYMYIYNNYSMEKLSDSAGGSISTVAFSENNYIIKNMKLRIEKFWNSLYMVRACINKLIFNTPIPRRSKQIKSRASF